MQPVEFAMKTIILAGGKGRRISSVATDIPKPMIKICGKPVLEYGIECLRKQGFNDLIITVSHLGAVIMEYFGDGSGISPVTGEPFNVKIEYFIEENPLGNAGALLKLRDRLKEDFLLLNGDLMFDIDIRRILDFHTKHSGIATLFTHPNNHPYDSGLIVADENNVVQQWLSKEDIRPDFYKNRVNAGIHVLSPAVLDNVSIDDGTVKIDLDRHLLKPLAGTGQMLCYDSPEYVKDMGTPERYKAVSRDYVIGRIAMKNLKNKQKAIFLDRDGTINRYVGFLRSADEFDLLPKVTDAIKKINDAGYLAIVITNQPVIARGEASFSDLKDIHNKMETLLGREGAYLDGIYICPHHPDKGFEGEMPELKIECGCRKPKPGLLLWASEDFNIDLMQSWMIGDNECDIIAGRTAGCHTALVGTGDFGQEETAKSLYEIVSLITER